MTKKLHEPDLADTGSMMLTGAGALLYASAPSMDAMVSPQTEHLSKVGQALESGSVGKVRSAVKKARAVGLDPGLFCYRDRTGMWFTPLLALMARNTQKHLALALSLAKEGAEGGWCLDQERCWVACPAWRGASPVLLEFEQAAPALLALNASSPSSNARERMSTLAAQFQASMEGWDLDWHRPSRDGHTALMEVVRRAPLGVAEVCCNTLLKESLDPLFQNDEGMSALDYLEERLQVNCRSDPSHTAMGERMRSHWKAMALEQELPEAPAPSSRPFRL